MTRLNLIEPEHLTNRHLIAEYKEITQFIHLVRPLKPGEGNQYTLNKGHCTFFYNKGPYLIERFEKLRDECEKRGFNIDPVKFQERINRIKQSYQTVPNIEYTPSPQDYRLVIDRIIERINSKPHLYPDQDRFFSNIKLYC